MEVASALAEAQLWLRLLPFQWLDPAEEGPRAGGGECGAGDPRWVDLKSTGVWSGGHQPSSRAGVRGLGEHGAGSAEEGAAVLKYSGPAIAGLHPPPSAAACLGDNLALSTAAKQAVNPHPSARPAIRSRCSHYGLNYFVKDEK